MVNLGPDDPIDESDIKPGADLPGADFSGVDLSDIDLPGAYLAYAVWR